MPSAAREAAAGLRQILQKDREFVATETRGGVARPDARGQPARHFEQERVAGGVAEAVVHCLEVVEIHHQDGVAAGAASEALVGMLETISEERTIRAGRSAHRETPGAPARAAVEHGR